MQNIRDNELVKNRAYVDGQWIEADDTTSFDVVNPATGEVLCTVPDLGESETEYAVHAADLAFKEWRHRPAYERAAMLRNWYNLVIENREDLAVLMTLEQGKVIGESRAEITYGASYIEWFAEESKRIMGDTFAVENPHQRGITTRQPVGVVGAITPWNFPNAMITRKAAPAIAAGCSIVIKPAAETPLSALALCELASRAGLPKGVINVVTTTRSESVGRVLTQDRRVRKFTFTGSTKVGKVLQSQCAGTMKKTSMELGGNAPIIIFPDADVQLAVTGAIASKFRNSGQTCICVNRILVHKDVHDKFVREYVKAIATFRVGNGLESHVTHGPLIGREAAVKVNGLVQDAVSDGASLQVGGSYDTQGESFYSPTVLTNVTPDMKIYNEEIFGPVATVVAFDTEGEALTMANDSDYGLAAYLYTKDLSRAWRVSEALEFGMVGVNETAISSSAVPFGGIKESGIGREGSRYGLEEYTEPKYVCLGAIG